MRGLCFLSLKSIDVLSCLRLIVVMSLISVLGIVNRLIWWRIMLCIL